MFFALGVWMVSLRPLAWPAVSLALVAAFAGGIPIGARLGSPSWLAPLLAWLLLATLLAMAAGVAIGLRSWRVNQRSLGRLAELYVALLLQFALVYFLCGILWPGSTPIYGVASPWRGRTYDAGSLLAALTDCVHFSCVTMATVGYGDMRPAVWWTKLIVDCQILAGIWIVVVGLGRHFAHFSSEDQLVDETTKP